jgi:hypothetical protein
VAAQNYIAEVTSRAVEDRHPLEQRVVEIRCQSNAERRCRWTRLRAATRSQPAADHDTAARLSRLTVPQVRLSAIEHRQIEIERREVPADRRVLRVHETVR